MSGTGRIKLESYVEGRWVSGIAEGQGGLAMPEIVPGAGDSLEKRRHGQGWTG